MRTAIAHLFERDRRGRVAGDGVSFPAQRGAAAAANERGPRVVIIGGGFGGLSAARALAGAAADVTLIDRHNYHLFQPLLYQVATGFRLPTFRRCASPGRRCKFLSRMNLL